MAEENWGSGASTTSKDPYGQLKVLRSPLIPITSSHIPTIRNLIPTIRTLIVPVDPHGRLKVLSSSTQLFLYIKRSMKECSAITKVQRSARVRRRPRGARCIILNRWKRPRCRRSGSLTFTSCSSGTWKRTLRVPAPMWASPGADVGEPWRRWRVPASMWLGLLQVRCAARREDRVDDERKRRGADKGA